MDVSHLRGLPSVDAVLKTRVASDAIVSFGRHAVVTAVRAAIAAARVGSMRGSDAEFIAMVAVAQLLDAEASRLKPVFNLTGIVLHTNLGRAQLAQEAIDAAIIAMRHAVALEFDLGDAKRGERDDIVRDLLQQLTGAEDATVVNNNAAAVLITLNTLAEGRDAIVSRGELIEIGGAFRMPEIMKRAGATLVEVGTTNRTHARDYIGALNERTGVIFKVHSSNYRIEGFTAEVSPRVLATIAREQGVPLIHDLGSGTLIDLSVYGLGYEPTVGDVLRDGADLVTFSGDKLLGGPQAGFIVGRKDLIARVNKNPMKRALRVDKVRLAAIEATLKLYRDPDSLAQRLPTLRFISRSRADILAMAQQLLPIVAAQLGASYSVEVIECSSQVGSGSLPSNGVVSAGLSIRPSDPRRSGRLLDALTKALRGLPLPVIGRIKDKALLLDFRCLDDEQRFLQNLSTIDSVLVRATQGSSA